jgi:hypothetical protein
MSVRSERGDYTAEARRIGASRSAALQGLGPAVENLDQLQDALNGEQMQALVEEHTRIMHLDAVSRARVWVRGRGQYWRNIRSKVFMNADGFAGTVFVLQGAWERRPSTRAPKNLPLWLEYGTRLMKNARPHLLPALHAARERFNRALERLLQRNAA